MELLKDVIDIFLHLDRHLSEIITNYGVWTYAILFLIIFVETGFVVMPFLPGDSLLFAAGAFTVSRIQDGQEIAAPLDLITLMALLFVAAVIGDTLNYHIGKYFGPKVFSRDYRFLKRSHLLKTQAFYEKHGGKTIIIARFIPIIRTFAPFVAGVGTMRYPKFIAYNVVGAFLWVVGFIMLGHFFGNLPVVKRNFTLVIFGIILVSIMPPTWEYIKHIRTKRRNARLAKQQQ